MANILENREKKDARQKLYERMEAIRRAKSRSLVLKRRKYCLSCYSSDYIDGFSNFYDFNNYVLFSIKHVFM